MSAQTQLKGSVTLSTDAGSTTTIGGAGLVLDTIQANTLSGPTNLFTTKTGGTITVGSSSSNTTMSGTSVLLNNPSINNPTTINYATTSAVSPARGTAFNQQFYASNIIENTFNTQSVGSAQAVYNGLPYGRYLVATYFFLPPLSGTYNAALRFCSAVATITNGQTTGLTVYGQGVGEAFGFKNQTGTGREFSLNATFIFDCNTTTGQNVGLFCSTSTNNIINAFCTLQLLRLS